MDCYIRDIPHDLAKVVAPEMPEIDPDARLYGLFDEDGSLVLLTDNRSSTFFKANAEDMTVKARH